MRRDLLGVCSHHIHQVFLREDTGGHGSLENGAEDIEHRSTLNRATEHRGLLDELLCSQQSLPQIVAHLDVGVLEILCPDASEDVAAGDCLELSIESSSGGRQLELGAREVWTGAGTTHGCEGFGLEFVQTLAK